MSDGRCFSATHRGAIRAENQDALICRPEIGVYAIADGAGGHADGQVAARAVTAGIGDIAVQHPVADRPDEVLRRIGLAHDLLLQGGDAASTVVVLVLDGLRFVCLWAGDSRIYLWRQGGLVRLTHDHSLVQEMIDAGTLLPEQARTHPRTNVITRAVGGGSGSLHVDRRTGEAMPGDRFLLCSDGLTRTMEDDEICRLLGSDGDVAAVMLDTALRRGARDNVSLIVLCRN